MPLMTYGDMKETETVFWRVRASGDPAALDLYVDDILIFEGTPPTGTMTRYHKGAVDHPNWAIDCNFMALGQDAKVLGTHFSNNPVTIDVKSRITTGGKATLTGTVDFPSPLGSVTWMADEGP